MSKRVFLFTLACFALFAVETAAQGPIFEEEGDLQISESSSYLVYTDEASGAVFSLTSDSDSPKSLFATVDETTLEAQFVEMTFFGGGLVAETVVVDGFEPSTEYHLYRDDFDDHAVVMSDVSGAIQFVQDASSEHRTWIQYQPSTIFLRDDATGGQCEAAGHTWTDATNTCTLTADLTETIQFNMSGITLDCKGHSITGSGTGYGVYVPTGSHDTVIRGCVVSGFAHQIRVNNSSRVEIRNSTTTGGNVGIYGFGTVDGLIVDNNIADDAASYGVYVSGDFAGLTISNNDVNDSGSTGIQVFANANSSNAALSNNVIFSAGGSRALYVRALGSAEIDGVLIENNDIQECSNSGFGVSWARNVQVLNNSLYGFAYTGLFTQSVVNGVFEGNTLETTAEGSYPAMSAISTQNVVFRNNTVIGPWESCMEGRVDAGLGESASFEDNTCTGIRAGIDIGVPAIFGFEYNGATYTGNTVTATVVGVRLRGEVFDNTFNGNTITAPIGVVFDDCTSDSRWVMCDHPQMAGIDTSNPEVDGNLIYDNRFEVDTPIEHVGIGTNIWNVAETVEQNIYGGPSLGGNLWLNSSGTGFSDTCDDVDDDGFCDSSLTLAADEIDNLPLSTYENVGGVDVDVESGGTDVDATSEENEDGSTTVTITEEGTPEGNEYVVTFPDGAEAPDGETDISIEVVGGNKPAIVINADLPLGTTKDITLSRGVGVHVCVDDRSDAQIISGSGRCFADRIPLPLDDPEGDGECIPWTVEGDPGDNPSDPSDPLGLHDIEVCVSADGEYVSVNGLLHSMVAVLGDEDGDGVTDGEDLCPGTDLNGPVPTQSLRPGHMGDDEVILGCNASQIIECMPGQNVGPTKFGLAPGLQEVFHEGTGWAWDCRPDLSLPLCDSTNGDMDGDGVLDSEDSDETDSSYESSTGFEDPDTGEADGLPDCRVL